MTNIRPAVPVESTATYTGVQLGVSFSFDYPAAWTVTDESPSYEDAVGVFTVTDHAGAEIASLTILPHLSVSPCYGTCADFPVIRLGEIPGDRPLDDRPFMVRTKAMDLTPRRDLQTKNWWNDNVKLIVGIEGNAESGPAEQDPSHFTAMTGISTGPSIESLRPLIFGAFKHFPTVKAAKVYTSTTEHAQIQKMLASFRAVPAVAAR